MSKIFIVGLVEKICQCLTIDALIAFCNTSKYIKTYIRNNIMITIFINGTSKCLAQYYNSYFTKAAYHIIANDFDWNDQILNSIQNITKLSLLNYSNIN